MGDVTRGPAALELLRLQRARLTDRIRLPWWYLAGNGIVWAVIFASPLSSRYLSRGVPVWPVFAAAVAVACLMQCGLTRATGMKLPFRNLRYPSPGRPVRIAMLVVFLIASETEFLLIRHGLIVAAVVAAALAVGAEMACLQAARRVTRRELRENGEVA